MISIDDSITMYSRAHHIQRNLDTDLFLHMPHLRLHRRQSHAHRAADRDGAVDRADQAFRRMAGHRHAFAELAHHVDDVVADRTDQRAAPAQRAAVVDQLLPFVEFRSR